MGILRLIECVSSVIDKLVPSRRRRDEKALIVLEKQLDSALKRNDTAAIALIGKRMQQLRDTIYNADK